MKEAHIVCLTRDYKVPDLRITLKKGVLVKRDEAVARGSNDLQHALRMGAVSIRYVQKAQEIRQPSPESSRRAPKREFVPPTPTARLPRPVGVARPIPVRAAPPKAEDKRKPKKIDQIVESDQVVVPESK